MSTFNEELIAKAKQAKSAEELLALAKENEVELSADEAKEYFEQLNKSGELSDDELDNVSGGGCQTTVNGSKYTVVSSGCLCFTGKYKPGVRRRNGGPLQYEPGAEKRPEAWYLFCNPTKMSCGTCIHLGFKGGTGYCKESGK